MAQVVALEAQVWTADDNNSSTDSPVFLGIGGRQFRLDSRNNNFDRGVLNTFWIVIDGTPSDTNAQVVNPEMNDPSKPVRLLTERLGRYRTYLRHEGGDHWKVERVVLNVYIRGEDGQLELSSWYTALQDDAAAEAGGLWLGKDHGRELQLNPANLSYIPRDVPEVPGIVRE